MEENVSLETKKYPFCPLEYNLHAIMNKKGVKIMGNIVGEISPTGVRYCFLRVVKSVLQGINSGNIVDVR